MRESRGAGAGPPLTREALESKQRLSRARPGAQQHQGRRRQRVPALAVRGGRTRGMGGSGEAEAVRGAAWSRQAGRAPPSFAQPCTHPCCPHPQQLVIAIHQLCHAGRMARRRHGLRGNRRPLQVQRRVLGVERPHGARHRLHRAHCHNPARPALQGCTSARSRARLQLGAPRLRRRRGAGSTAVAPAGAGRGNSSGAVLPIPGCRQGQRCCAAWPQGGGEHGLSVELLCLSSLERAR